MTATAPQVSEWLDARDVARELRLFTKSGKPNVGRLRSMAKRRVFPELLHVDHGIYRVPRREYEQWQQARMTIAEATRAELQHERVREALVKDALATKKKEGR